MERGGQKETSRGGGEPRKQVEVKKTEEERGRGRKRLREQGSVWGELAEPWSMLRLRDTGEISRESQASLPG